jgi:CubicO group peptidase (beta-lactamase class C family)
VDVSWKLGGGGYLGSVTDLALFTKGLLDGRLVSATTTARMWTPQKTRTGEATVYGLGFLVERDAPTGGLKVFHEGSQEGAKGRMVLYPSRRSAVVVLCNSEWAEPGKISTAVYSALAAARRNNP